MRLLTVLLVTVIFSEAKKQRLNDVHEDEMNKFIPFHDLEFNRPVPFGHIFKDGFEDPSSAMKQPIDLLEMDTIYLRDSDSVREFLKKSGVSYQRIQKNTAQQFDIPREVYVDDKVVKGNESELNNFETYWNLAQIQQKNLYDRPHRRINKRKEYPRPSQIAREPMISNNYKGKAGFFDGRSYGLQSNRRVNMMNWTTCDEFGRNANFHPNDIVDIEWVPFYIWSYDFVNTVSVSQVHRFSYPKKKRVVKYKEEYGPFINRSIDWEQPKLLIKTPKLEMLLIAADRQGLFDAIPFFEIPQSMKNSKMSIPLKTLRLKIVAPYLALMYCNTQYATIMAVAGDEPRNKREKISEAAALKFHGKGMPVARNLQMEKIMAQAQAVQNLAQEDDKFITLEDQMNASKMRI